VITLHWCNPEDVQALLPLEDEARRRGHRVEMRGQGDPPGDLSVYLHGHERHDGPTLSALLLHDVGQGFWPEDNRLDDNHWRYEPWASFDLALVPGPSWVRAWREHSVLPEARPRVGVVAVGWPRADRLFDPSSHYDDEVAALRRELDLPDRPTILFVPSWETDGFDYVRRFHAGLADLDVNLVGKYCLGYPDLPESLAPELPRYRRIEPSVRFLTCLGLADVVVSEESSCLGEALLLDVPPVSVTDWDVPALPHLNLPQRPCDPPVFATHTDSDHLGECVREILGQLDHYRAQARHHRDDVFAHLGSASAAVLDALEWARAGDPRLSDVLERPAADPS